MTPDTFQKFAEGGSAIAVGVAALWGVSRYSIASSAEARARRSAEIETEAKIAQQFDALLKVAESYGDNGLIVVGLASQRSAIRSMVRLVRLHPRLKDAALSGLTTLRSFPSMASNYECLDAAIADVRAVADD